MTSQTTHTVTTLEAEDGESFATYAEAERFARRMSRLVKTVVIVCQGESWEDESVAAFQHGEQIDHTNI